MSSSSSSSDSSSGYSSSDFLSFKRSSIDISNLDTFLCSSITFPYMQQTYPPTDPSVVSAVSSVLRGGSFDISVPRDVSAALSERSSAVEREVREIGSGRGRGGETGEKGVEKWMRERRTRLGDMVESWVHNSATSSPFTSNPSGKFSDSQPSSTPSSITATGALPARELFSASRRRLATTTAANLKPPPPTIDPSTARTILSYIQSVDSSSSGSSSNSNPASRPLLNEEHWWTAYHALRSPSAFGAHGVPIALSEKLASMRALGWGDVVSDVRYEREKARMFLGDERLTGSHLQGNGIANWEQVS
ncbi:hypothetical protein I306_05607 [Cryptococcus gattii EJB2]|uniref:Uncharacterized protein n=1 Tax=Cryptococcus gattii EJB2 TaxID=1296103 RepID=A0ABR5BP24_9TREE|nr:hypothetical protein I306_05607 [Cryptococcus gattii EJB2]